jgi:anti-anti-sigma factor
MDAKVENIEGVFVVTLEGQLNFETADSLKRECLKKFNEQRIIFNLKNLSFVGSSGITPFMDLLSQLSRQRGRDLKLCSVSSEFMRLFQSGDFNGLEIYENAEQAKRAFKHQREVASAIQKVEPFGIDYDIE